MSSEINPPICTGKDKAALSSDNLVGKENNVSGYKSTSDEDPLDDKKPRLSGDSGCEPFQESSQSSPDVFVAQTMAMFDQKLMEATSSIASDVDNNSSCNLQSNNFDCDDYSSVSKPFYCSNNSISSNRSFNDKENSIKLSSPQMIHKSLDSKFSTSTPSNQKNSNEVFAKLNDTQMDLNRGLSSSNNCATSDYSSLSSNNSSKISDTPNSLKHNSFGNISTSSNRTIKDNVSDTSEGSKTVSIKNHKFSSSPTQSEILHDSFDGSDVNTALLTGSCLKAGPKGVSTVHVQFDTPQSPAKRSANKNTYVGFDGSVSLEENRPLVDSSIKIVSRTQNLDGTYNSSGTKHKKPRRHLSGSTNASFGSSSTSSESVITEFERRAPDGGWGWMVVLASFFVHCIADGITMSFGVLFVEFLSYFKENKSLTSLIGSLFSSIPLLAGPIASVLTDRFGCRSVTIWGSVIACLGFFISAFCDSIIILLITVGVISGLGLAVCYVAAIVIVAFYFEKKRSLATGIAVAGSGIGTFLFAPLIQYLIEQYGWRGCLIILAGIFLNMAVCGSVMRDLEWTKRKSNKKTHSTFTASSSKRGSPSQSSDTLGGHSPAINTAIPSVDELRRLIQSGDIAALLSPTDQPFDAMRGSASLVQLPTFLNHTQALPPDLYPCFTSKTNAYEVVSKMYPHLLTRSFSGCLNQNDIPPKELTQSKIASEIHLRCNDSMTRSIPVPRKSEDSTIKMENIPFIAPDAVIPTISEIQLDSSVKKETQHEHDGWQRASRTVVRPTSLRRISCIGEATPNPPSETLRNMRVNRQSMTYRGAMLNIYRYRLRASSCPDIYRNSILTIARNNDQNNWTIKDDLNTMFNECLDFSYCADPSFLVFALSNFILYVFYDTVYMYLADYATGVGVEKDDSSKLISAIGILNCFGMVVMGYIGDQTWGSPLLIYNLSMILCGLATIIIPFLEDYWMIAAASSLFGLFISANYALTSVILVELVSLKSFSKAYGLLLLIQGFANLIGPPIVGFMADETGNYTVPFVISGIFIVISGLILCVIPIFQRCKNYSKSDTVSTPITVSSNLHASLSP